MSLNERVAREVMGWPVVEKVLDVYSREPETSCFIDNGDILKGTAHRFGLKRQWNLSWKRWTPDKDIAQAFEVVDEVLSWEWDNDVWFEMTVDGKKPVVELTDSFGSISYCSGESLPEVICQVALWAWRKGGAKGRSEDE